MIYDLFGDVFAMGLMIVGVFGRSGNVRSFFSKTLLIIQSHIVVTGSDSHGS
jgi:hypothetical protein